MSSGRWQNRKPLRSFCITGFTLLSITALAEQPVREPLWPGIPPLAKGTDPMKDIPAITVYSPDADNRNGTAVIVCPGGGYGTLAMDHEGRAIAEWFNGMGITAVVLEYRMARGGYQHPVPLMDAQRAIRLVRHRARDLDIDPGRVGIIGFSAGGHLASTAGTHFDAGDPESEDPVGRMSCRPDFMILCYPVIAFGEPFTHKGSQHNLIGEEPSEELVRSLSNEKQVTKDTPPTFLFHTQADTVVPVDNSRVFHEALQRAGVPAELKLYPEGSHGLGLAENMPGTSEWPEACRFWLKGLGLLE